jgi:hypothetical protein
MAARMPAGLASAVRFKAGTHLAMHVPETQGMLGDLA